MWVEVRQN